MEIVSVTADSGPGSLRQAVASAPAGSSVRFANTLSGQTILLTGGEIVLSNSMTIDGSSLTNGVRINGGGSSDVFHLINTDTTVTLTALTIMNGVTAINNEKAALTVNSCSVVGNLGDGIDNNGTLTVDQ